MLGRLIAWISDEIIVKNLANNRTFQRFALHVDDKLTKNKAVMENIKNGKADEIKKEALNTVKGFDAGKVVNDAMSFLKRVHSNVK
eukprot:gene31895-38563_t